MKYITTSVLVLLVSTACFATPARIPDKPSDWPELKSIYAGLHYVTDFQKEDTRAMVFVFTGVYCPVAQQYGPRLQALHERFAEQGVIFLSIYSSTGVDLMSMARHAQDIDLPFPALLDVEHRLADQFDVSRTPEIVVLDANLERQYQGAIDDQFTKRGRRPEATSHFLADALTSVLAGEQVQTAYVPVSGCPIERHGPPQDEDKYKYTYYRDIAPIIQNNCQSCHRPGEVGPFSLLNYDDAYNYATTIAEVVEERRMPPWHAFLNPKFGELVNHRALEEKDIRAILSWVQQGAPAGDAKDAPEPIQWPDPNAWKIGKPDYVYKMPKPFLVPKTGVLEYQFFRVKLNFQEDRWFQAVEVKPGNRTVVHHVGLHMVPSDDREYKGLTGMAALYGFNTERARLINDYVPGDPYNAKVYPPHQAVRIPKGCDLVYELHYTPNNRQATTDQSMAAFRWAPQAPEQEVLTRVFRKPIGRFRILPHDPHGRMDDSYFFEHDVLVDAIRPHFHYRAKSYRLELIERDEETDEVTRRETVFTVPVWDPDWQRTYELKTPLFVKAGTELLATGHFDNSELNPNNPDPSAVVLWGQQSTDEMFSTRFKYHVAKSKDQ